jgi:hypothetical protein
LDNVGPNLLGVVGGWGQKIGAALSGSRAAPILYNVLEFAKMNFVKERVCDR